MGASELLSRPAELLTPDDWPLLESLFLSVFGHPLERESTAWKYAPGHGLSIGVRNGGEGPEAALVAHCGLMFRDVLDHGQKVCAAQFADLMVAPAHRGQLLRRGSPFAKVVAHAMSLLGTAVNPGNPDRLTFGFPSERAMRLAEQLGLVCEVDHVFELAWAPAAGAVAEPVSVDDPSIVAIVDRLWSAMRADLAEALVGVRDARYFLGRYLRHPTRSYAVHLVRSADGDPVAVFAVRPEGGSLTLADWVAPLGRLGVTIDAARAVTAAAGLPSLATWMTRDFVDRLSPDTTICRPTEFRIIGRGDLSADARARHSGRWWLTPGDTDYR